MSEIDNAIRNHEMIRLELKAGATLTGALGSIQVEKTGQVALVGIPTRFDRETQTLGLSRWRVAIAAVADIDYLGVDDVPPLDKPTDDYGVPTSVPTSEDITRWWTENPEYVMGIDTRDGAAGTVTI